MEWFRFGCTDRSSRRLATALAQRSEARENVCQSPRSPAQVPRPITVVERLFYRVVDKTAVVSGAYSEVCGFSSLRCYSIWEQECRLLASTYSLPGELFTFLLARASIYCGRYETRRSSDLIPALINLFLLSTEFAERTGTYDATCYHRFVNKRFEPV